MLIISERLFVCLVSLSCFKVASHPLIPGKDRLGENPLSIYRPSDISLGATARNFSCDVLNCTFRETAAPLVRFNNIE